MKRVLLALVPCILAVCFHPLHGQGDTTKLFRQFAFLPMPNPANGFMFGVAPSASWMMGSEATTHRSSLVSTVIYTTKKQLILTLKTNIFLKDDSWNLMGDWRYFVTSQPTFGLGTGPQTARLVSTGIEFDDGSISKAITEPQMMKFNFFRLHQTVLKRIRNTRFFGGVGFHLDMHNRINDQLLDLESVPPAITSHYAYSTVNHFDPESYTLLGLSLNGLYDSRNNPLNPYSGRYAFISMRINPSFMGSDKSSSLLWIEYRDYVSLSEKRPRHLIGFWTYANLVTSGDVPYLDLPALGWDQFGRSGRGYPQGRFRGENLVYGEAEYRFPLQKRKDTFGGVIFVNAATANNTYADIKMFRYVDPGMGAGLRVMVNKKSRANLSIDYAWGLYGSHGFYLNINEVF